MSIHNKWPLAREGIPFVAGGFVLIFLSLWLSLYPLFLVFGLLTLFILLFFRDPDRQNEAPPKAVLTPADGKIIEIRREENTDNPRGEPSIRVSIFMSIFNVHVNRIPIGGTVTNIVYRPGKFFSANLSRASQYNENNRITLQTNDSHRVVLIQIAGLIARRIACWIQEGDSVQAGQRFGLIRFGSRVEICLPADTKLTVNLQQKVRAGKTILGYLP